MPGVADRRQAQPAESRANTPELDPTRCRTTPRCVRPRNRRARVSRERALTWPALGGANHQGHREAIPPHRVQDTQFPHLHRLLVVCTPSVPAQPQSGWRRASSTALETSRSVPSCEMVTRNHLRDLPRTRRGCVPLSLTRRRLRLRVVCFAADSGHRRAAADPDRGHRAHHVHAFEPSVRLFWDTVSGERRFRRLVGGLVSPTVRPRRELICVDRCFAGLPCGS